MDQKFSLFFHPFLLARAGAAARSALWSRELPGVTSVINTALHCSTGNDSIRMKPIH